MQIERVIANTILKHDLVHTLKETDEFCFYNGGYFHRGKDPLTIIRNKIDDIAKYLQIPGPKDTLKPYYLSISKRNTILEMIRTNSFASLLDFDKDPNRICALNGHLRYDRDNSWDYANHFEFNENPYKTFYQIPIKYDPKAECLVIDQFLTDVFGFNTVPLIYEMLAYFMMGHVNYQKAFILYGPPSSGKTTFIKLLYYIFDKMNFISEISLQDLGMRFQLENLMGKTLNIFDDLVEDKKVGSTSIFRIIVTGNYLSGEMKNVQGNVTWRNRTKLLFSCNTLPPIRKNEGDQFFRRWVLLSCFTIFKNEDQMNFEDHEDERVMVKDPEMLDKLLTPEELSGLLNKCMEAWERLDKRTYFPKEWNNIDYIKGLWMIDINPVKLFIDECCVIGPNEEADYELFFHTLNKFRESYNAKSITKTMCTQWLHKIDGIKKKKKGSGDFYYDGISVRDEALGKYQSEYIKKQLKDSQLDDF